MTFIVSHNASVPTIRFIVSFIRFLVINLEHRPYEVEFHATARSKSRRIFFSRYFFQISRYLKRATFKTTNSFLNLLPFLTIALRNVGNLFISESSILSVLANVQEVAKIEQKVKGLTFTLSSILAFVNFG